MSTLICPNCEADNESSPQIGGAIKCVGCEQWFKSPPAPIHISPPKPLPAPEVTEKKWEEHNASVNRRTVRGLAERLCASAYFFFVVGVIAVIASVLASVSGEDATIGWIIFGGCVTSGFWLFLIGQIVHIRANTEK